MHSALVAQLKNIITVAEYALSWAEKNRSRLRFSTRERYAEILGKFVVPVLGARAIAELTRADVLEWVTWAQEQETGRRRGARGIGLEHPRAAVLSYPYY